MAPAIRIESRRRMGRQAGQATWPWSHAPQMQTSQSQRTQRKRRASRSITGPRTADLSGHGRGVERWSTSERRLDHRDDPEGSGRSPRAFALSAAPSGYLTRPVPPRKRSQRPPLVDARKRGPRAVTQRVLQARYASAPPTVCSDALTAQLRAPPRPRRLAGPRRRRHRPSRPPRGGSR